MSDSATFDHGYALIVGVDDNETDGAQLPTVALDVQAVHDVLVHPQRCAYKPDNVKLLRGQDATADAILDAMQWLRQKVAADPRATAVFYYSGHGHLDEDSGSYYLIPYDFKGLDQLETSAILAQDFADRLAAIQAQRALLILDCCHAEGIEAKALGAGNDLRRRPFPIDQTQMEEIPAYSDDANGGSKSLDDLRALAGGNGRAVLNSSTNDQLSWVRRDGAMSLFTYHLIEGLTGHATNPNEPVVLVTDVMGWVQRKVPLSAEAENRAPQTPVLRTEGVFPVALSIGGEGVSKALGGAAPDPLKPLPPVQRNVNTGGGDYAEHDVNKSMFDMRGQTVERQTNIANAERIDHIGDNITEGSSFSFGDISHSSGMAFGDHASVTINDTPSSRQAANFDAIFAPLATIVAGKGPDLAEKVEALKAQVARAENADDAQVAGLVQDIADADPDTVATLLALFGRSDVSAAVGNTTRFVLGRLG